LCDLFIYIFFEPTREPNLAHPCQFLYWGWAFELKYDSLPRLGFKGVVCIHNTLDPPVALLVYKNELLPPIGVGFEPSVNEKSPAFPLFVFKRKEPRHYFLRSTLWVEFVHGLGTPSVGKGYCFILLVFVFIVFLTFYPLQFKHCFIILQ
jgi:hypothetical protein